MNFRKVSRQGLHLNFIFLNLLLFMLVYSFTVPTFNGGDRDNAEKLALPEPTETEPNRSALLLTRCQSLCCCIKTLLRYVCVCVCVGGGGGLFHSCS